MGYSIKSKKINIILAEHQQKNIQKVWINFFDNIPFKTWWIKMVEEDIKKKDTQNIEDFLDVLDFKYEKKGESLHIKSYEGKMQQQKDFFIAISSIISPGSYVTWRGEDGDIFGWFFNCSELIEFESYKELKKLREPFEMMSNLEKKLNNKTEATKIKKIKI